MFSTIDISSIGMRPILSGCAVLIIGILAGWRLAEDPSFTPLRLLRHWMESVILPVLRSKSWMIRTACIFANNGSMAGLLVLVGGLPGGAWCGTLLVGFSMGMVIRYLGQEELLKDVDEESEEHRIDGAVAFGLLLNLLEVPAILIVLGLSLGQLAAPNGLGAEEMWKLFSFYVLPMLLLAAAGESLWIGRLRPFS